jgi:hypothetical protein
MEEGEWRWSVNDVFTIEGQGVVVLGPLVGPFPSHGDRAVIEHGGQQVQTEVGGLHIMHVVGKPPRDVPVWSDHPVGLVLAGVRKDDVPVGAIVSGLAATP